MTTVSNDEAIAELNDAVAVGRVDVRVGDLNDRRAASIQGLEHLHDLLALVRVKIAGRFVGQDQLRVRDHRPGDADQLLLPAGELARIQILFPDDVKSIQRVADNRIAPGLVHVPVGKRNIQVLVNREIIEQVIVLENETDLFVPEGRAFLWLEGVDRIVVKKYSPLQA